MHEKSTKIRAIQFTLQVLFVAQILLLDLRNLWKSDQRLTLLPNILDSLSLLATTKTNEKAEFFIEVNLSVKFQFDWHFVLLWRTFLHLWKSICWLFSSEVKFVNSKIVFKCVLLFVFYSVDMVQHENATHTKWTFSIRKREETMIYCVKSQTEPPQNQT